VQSKYESNNNKKSKESKKQNIAKNCPVGNSKTTATSNNNGKIKFKIC